MGVIYLDACLVIYLMEGHARWGQAVAVAMAGEDDARFGISPLVKCECLVGPIKRGDPVLQRAYTELFDQFLSLAMPEAGVPGGGAVASPIWPEDPRRAAPRLCPAPSLRRLVDQ